MVESKELQSEVKALVNQFTSHLEVWDREDIPGHAKDTAGKIKRLLLDFEGWILERHDLASQRIDPEIAELLDDDLQRTTGCRFGTPKVCSAESHPDCYI